MARPLSRSRRSGVLQELRHQSASTQVADGPARQIDRSVWVTPEHGQLAWSVYSEQLLASRTHLAARTVETDRLCHERAVQWIGDVWLVQVTPELIRRMTSELADRYATATVARTMRWVRFTLNQAVRDRRILSSPADGIGLPRSRRSGMRLLDTAEVRALAAALPQRYSSLAITAAYTGLRWGELAGLRIGDIDMLRRRLTVRCNADRGIRPATQARPAEVRSVRANHRPPRVRRRHAGTTLR